MYGGDAENAFSLLASSFLFHEICFISRDAALRVAKALLHSEYIIDDIYLASHGFWTDGFAIQTLFVAVIKRVRYPQKK